MSAAGRFIKSGNHLQTTYPQTGNALYGMIDDFYNASYSMAKSAGYPSAGPYHSGGNYTTAYGDAYFNAVMGKEITAAMFSTDNIYTALGARPYAHEGVRISLELATYGLASADYGMSVSADDFFLGLGANTVRDGKLPSSVRMPVDEFREPYKEVPMKYDYGLGIQALEHKEDDTIQYKAYVEKMATNYSDEIDKMLLRPLYMRQPRGSRDSFNGQTEYGLEEETTITGIERCICSGTEVNSFTVPSMTVSGKLNKDYFVSKDSSGNDLITTDMVSPYGAAEGDFYRHRAKDITSSTNNHVQSNIDGNVIDLDNGTLSIGDMKKLYRICSIYWKDSANPNNKVFCMSNIAQDKLGALMLANNVLLDTQYVQRDFNGVKSIPGRDIGLLVNTFQNIPIMQDGNFNFDYTSKRVSDTKYGDIMLLDLDHIWMRMLTPVEMFNVNNPLISNGLFEQNLMNMRCELGIDSFIQHGRIKNIADDTI